MRSLIKMPVPESVASYLEDVFACEVRLYQ